MSDEPRKTLSDGTQIYPGHTNLRPSGQQEGYVVLAEEERAKGFVRPVRHRPKLPGIAKRWQSWLGCGSPTRN